MSLLCRRLISVFVSLAIVACSLRSKGAPIPNVPLWDYRSDSAFRVEATNVTRDSLPDIVPGQNVDTPILRRAGLYRYRVRSIPFGVWTLGAPGAPWISVQDPPKSYLYLDNFEPPIRAIGVQAFSLDGLRQSNGYPLHFFVYTKRGAVARVLRSTGEHTFIGVRSPAEPITAIAIASDSLSPGKYPALRAVFLGSAQIRN